MFILKDEVSVWWPVKVKQPDEKKAGRFVEFEFELEMRIMDRDEIEERGRKRVEILEAEAAPADVLRRVNEFDDETFVDVITDWRGVLDEDKEPIAFSRDILIKALKRPLIRKAIEKAYSDLCSGEVARKN
jgi:hypothetical protein